MMMDFRDNIQKCNEYIHALEQERGKILVFQRELPLCLELVTQAIEACKQRVPSGTSTTECLNGHSECSEQTTSDGPILEEFIPLKRSNSTDDDDDGDELLEESSKTLVDKLGKKSDWLRSVQLWNHDPLSDPEVHEHQPKKVSVVDVKKKTGGAFHPFQKEKGSSSIDNKPSSSLPLPAASACSSAEAAPDGGRKKEEKGGPSSQRKSRRCWSPELHRRFLHALQQLGGSHVGTPKQIRELMKVDGLTNDEVKSHLQKYRLHTRRPTQAVHQNSNPQQAQFVVVGGIWVPPPDYGAVASATTSGDTTPPGRTIYAPVAAVAQPSSPPTQSSQPNKGSSPSHSDVRGSPSNSPATSTGSHAY